MNKFLISSLGIFPVRWPLRWTFATAMGSKSYTDNLIVRLGLSGGSVGYAEASSSLAMARQTRSLMAAALRRLIFRFRQQDVRDAEKIIERSWLEEGRFPTAVAAFETAVWDALARACGMPFTSLWGGVRTSHLTTTFTVPAVAPDTAAELVSRVYRKGFRVLKLKLNGHGSPGSDMEIIRRTQRSAPKARLLADCNQSYTPALLTELLRETARSGIEIKLVEQPFEKDDWKALRFFHRGARVPVILDESVRSPQDAVRAVKEGSCDGVNIKLAKSGLMGGREIIRCFEESAMSSNANSIRFAKTRPMFMIGCMAESPIGLSASIQWACALGKFDYVDLDSDLFVRGDASLTNYVRNGPEIVLPKVLPAGLGVEWHRPTRRPGVARAD